MKIEYTGYRIHPVYDGTHIFTNRTITFTFTNEQLDALHQLIECNDDNCPGFQAGYLKGLEAEREPFRSRA